MDKGNAEDIMYLNFKKAFDLASHDVLMVKLGNCGLDHHTVQWLGSWLWGQTQRVLVDDSKSTWYRVTSGVP